MKSSAQDHFHRASETEMHATPDVLGHTVAGSDNSSFHLPDPAFCSPGCSCTYATQGLHVKVITWWKSTLPGQFQADWLPEHLTTLLLVFSLFSLLSQPPQDARGWKSFSFSSHPMLQGCTWSRIGESCRSHSCAESLLVKQPHVSR